MKTSFLIGLMSLFLLSGCAAKKPVQAGPEIDFIIPINCLTAAPIMKNCSVPSEKCQSAVIHFTKGCEQIQIDHGSK